MAEVQTYDVSRVNVLLGGRAITGFSSDGVVTLTHNEDRVTTAVGSKGDVVYSENANNTGLATITLLSTSSSLPYIRELCEKRREFVFAVSDANADNAFYVNAERCRVTKMPDTARVKESGSVDITVFIPDLVYR